ncbi:MAG: hypothetical protein H0V62_11450 [Gammaproteobacteria bacterium]|nr:hypothetical protein [Gammaproteobacteria bacterium]
MRIENLRTGDSGERVRQAASVVWEDSERVGQEVYFEVSKAFADGFYLNPDAFLLACVLPAMHHRETRIVVDAGICPGLIEGLKYVLATMRHWFYDPQQNLIHIESGPGSYENGPAITEPAKGKIAGSLFSSGVDSLALLRDNQLRYPPDHPWFIRNAFIIMGQNIESDMSEATLRQAVIDFSAVTADAGATLIPVVTNIRELETDGKFFLRVNHGAIMASVMHAFARRLHTAFIASSDSIGELAFYKQQAFPPWGSHPLIDNYYSSANLQIRHENLALTRLDKLRVLADWGAGLQHIRVCGRNWPGPNCGKCEKCVRTQLGLLALGLLDKTKAFPANDLTAEDLNVVRVKHFDPRFNIATRAIYYEFIPYLERAGRDDLVRAIKRADKPRNRKPQARVKSAIKRLLGQDRAPRAGTDKRPLPK